MTYERPEILNHTIDSLLAQTYPPKKILIIDNSETFNTQNLIAAIGNSHIVYHRVGYNAGPAGAARIGLQILAGEGYKWIYWGDDDDPPNFNNSFKTIFEIIKLSNLKIGIIGEVGQYFNPKTGELARVSDSELLRNDYLIVNSVAGNQCMVVNADVVNKGIMPDDSLFFGFEELDFCLKVEKAGFDIVTHSGLMYDARKYYNRLSMKRPLYIKKENLKRVYYSTRNSFVILVRNHLYIALLYQVIKNSFKLVYGFRFGWFYGKMNFKMISNGVYDGLLKRLGKRF